MNDAIVEVEYGANDVVEWTYDANGNRLTETVNSALVHGYSYDDADQLASDGTTSYTWDLNGNLTGAGSDGFTWDWNNRLSEATVGSVASEYAYDGDGARVSQEVNSVVTPYVWDRAGGLPLLLDDGNSAYLHAGGVLAEIDGSNDATYHLGDGLGSVRGLSDGSGAVTGTADYDVFGEVSGSSGASSVFGYTGEQRDASTGNTYLRARYLDPGIGRFLSADTVQPNAPGTQGYNRYAYAANNPARWTDPSGHAVGDLAALQAPLAVLVEKVQAIGALTVALMPALLALGMLVNPIGLLLSVQFVLLAIALILVVAQALLLVQDPFRYYEGDAPTGPARPMTPQELEDAGNGHPTTPEEECPGLEQLVSADLVISVLQGDFSSDHPLIGALARCVAVQRASLPIQEFGARDILDALACFGTCLLQLAFHNRFVTLATIGCLTLAATAISASGVAGLAVSVIFRNTLHGLFAGCGIAFALACLGCGIHCAVRHRQGLDP